MAVQKERQLYLSKNTKELLYMKYRGMFTFILSVHTEYPYCGVNYEGNGVFYWPFAVLKGWPG